MDEQWKNEEKCSTKKFKSLKSNENYNFSKGLIKCRNANDGILWFGYGFILFR